MKTNIDEALKAIENLDLSKIKMKLMISSPKGQGWTQEKADITEKWYKRFLILHLRYPDAKKVPNAPIDAFWHLHILVMRKRWSCI